MSDLFWWSRRESVTFRDPEKTSLKTSLQEFVSLRTADLAVLTRIVCWQSRLDYRRKTKQRKIPITMDEYFSLVISPGIEPGLSGWEPGVLTVRRWDHTIDYNVLWFDSPRESVTFRDPASQSNEYNSFVTSPCKLPLAIFTRIVRMRTWCPNR